MQQPKTNPTTPLAERMRPRTLDALLGQPHLLTPGKPLRQMIEQDRLRSIIFWGPPGSGKTTLAHLIARHSNSRFLKFSAVTSGIKEVREVMQQAAVDRAQSGQQTVVFIDEIHRFNKAQQDAFLPFVEDGTIILIGATTENPSFQVTNALLSRCKVFVTHQLTLEALVAILQQALADEESGLRSHNLQLETSLLKQIAAFSEGDARTALNTLELLADYLQSHQSTAATVEDLQEVLQSKSLRYDKAGEEHFNLISALHKCMRDSDPDAALYWLGRMLESGEDPLYIARRVIRFASEDVGLAAPQGLSMAMAAQQACHFVGMPECALALSQVVVYLSTAPKSNSLYRAYNQVREDVHHTINEPVPLMIRNAPTQLMQELGYGKGYQYAHDLPQATTTNDRLPPSLKGRRYYTPTEQGFEKEIKQRGKP